MLKGIRLEDGLARVKTVKMVSRRMVQLQICEGKKREVRRIFQKLGYEVIDLLRVAFGPIVLGDLVLGRGRYLSKTEVARLKSIVEPKTKRPRKS